MTVDRNIANLFRSAYIDNEQRAAARRLRDEYRDKLMAAMDAPTSGHDRITEFDRLSGQMGEAMSVLGISDNTMMDVNREDYPEAEMVRRAMTEETMPQQLPNGTWLYIDGPPEFKETIDKSLGV